MAGDELARPVRQRVLAREHRQAAQMAADVFGKLGDRGVPVAGILLERLEDDGVDVAPKLPTEIRAADGAARRRGLLLADGLRKLVRQVRADAVRASPGEDPIEQHAERVYVG